MLFSDLNQRINQMSEHWSMFGPYNLVTFHNPWFFLKKADTHWQGKIGSWKMHRHPYPLFFSRSWEVCSPWKGQYLLILPSSHSRGNKRYKSNINKGERKLNSLLYLPHLPLIYPTYPKLTYKDIMGDSINSHWSEETTCTTLSSSDHDITEGHQTGQAWFPLGEFVLTIPDNLLFHLLGNDIQNKLFHQLPMDRD